MVGCTHEKFIIEDIIIGYKANDVTLKVGYAWIVLDLAYLVAKADELYNDPTWDSEQCYRRTKSEYVCFDLVGDERRRFISRHEAFVRHMTSGAIKDICHPSFLIKDGYYGFGWLDKRGKSYYYDTGKRGKNGSGRDSKGKRCRARVDKKTKDVQRNIDVGNRGVDRLTAVKMITGATNLIKMDYLHYMKYPMHEAVINGDWEY